MPITLGLRPRLEFMVNGRVSDLTERLRAMVSDYVISVVDTYVVVTLPESRRHYWSPQLQVTLEDHDGTVHVHGLITPMPAVWTLFASSYFAILVLGFFGTIYGLAQLQLGNRPTGLWSIPLMLLLMGGVYAAAMVGQRIGHDQTEELTDFLHRCLDEEPSTGGPA